MAQLDVNQTDVNDPTMTLALNDAKINELKEAGFTDEEINTLKAFSSEETQQVVNETDFNTLNKQTLDALRYMGKLTTDVQKVVYNHAPVALVDQVSNPDNWDGDTYIGPGADAVAELPLGKRVDLTKPSLDALVMSVLTARASILQTQLEDQINGIQEKNDQLSEANDMLALAKDLKAKAGTSGSRAMTPEMVKFWDKLKAKKADGTNNYTSQEWDANIEGLKSRIEALTSQSQLETTKLQQTINKYNQTFEMLSNFISKYFQSQSSIIQNLR